MSLIIGPGSLLPIGLTPIASPSVANTNVVQVASPTVPPLSLQPAVAVAAVPLTMTPMTTASVAGRRMRVRVMRANAQFGLPVANPYRIGDPLSPTLRRHGFQSVRTAGLRSVPLIAQQPLTRSGQPPRAMRRASRSSGAILAALALGAMMVL